MHDLNLWLESWSLNVNPETFLNVTKAIGLPLVVKAGIDLVYANIILNTFRLTQIFFRYAVFLPNPCPRHGRIVAVSEVFQFLTKFHR